MRNLGPSMRPAAWARRLAIVGVIGAFNVPVVAPWAQAEYHDVQINRSSYKAQHGHWDMLPVPKDYQVRSIHAALLYTGKVLLIAGSGNDRKSFEAGSFKSLLWDPETNKYKLIHTPDDMFCGGHAFLPDGKLLIAGGTKRYEVLEGEVHNAAGVMTVSNESPDQAVALPKGTPFRAADGRVYRTQEAARLPRAAKTGAGRAVKVTASKTEVWVMAEVRGKGSVIKTTKMKKFTVGGMQGAQRRNVYGQANLITLDKQDFQGEKQSYLFDPATERYEKVDDMTLARWYPTLVGLKDGKVLSVSGLDSFGRMIEGTNEIYDPKTKQWTVREDLQRTFPTYPALFLMMGKGNRLFYTGSNAGYGSPEVGRVPGIWNLEKNTFRKVPGLRSPDETETSGSVLLSPAQDQKYMIVGGGGVGESHKSTSRMDVVDLKKDNPRFEPAGRLATGTRYPNLVLTPNDKVVITGGSSDYRGKGDSNLLYCNMYDPKTGALKQMADPTVGHNYHA
jgi:hypothetical protein